MLQDKPANDADQSPPALMPLVVRDKQPLTAAICQFELTRNDQTDLPGYRPGAHITVQTPAGAMRRYSLIGDPARADTYTIAVKREDDGRGGSLSLHQQTQIGDTLMVEPPQNEFELEQAARYLFIAGGIGITPILSMVQSLHRAGNSNYQLIYCTRSAPDTAFADMLSAPELAAQVIIHHDNRDADRAYDFWPLCETPDDSHIYCCGPQVLMDDIRDMTGHWPSHAVHFESFQPVSAVRAEDSAFDMRVCRADQIAQTLHVPADQTILEVLREHGYAVRSSCESGSCGTCKVAYRHAPVDHRDLVLTDQERETAMMVCVSRAASIATIATDASTPSGDNQILELVLPS